MQRIIIVIFLIASTHNILARDSSLFKGYLILGQSVPLKGIRKDSKSNIPIQITYPDNFSHSFRVGCTFHIYKNIGITSGLTIDNYLIDKNTFENIHLTNNHQFYDSYLKKGIRRYELFGGLTMHFDLKSFYIEPRLLIGISTYNLFSGYYSFYYKSNNGDIYSIVDYHIFESGSLSYSAGLNFGYQFKVPSNFMKVKSIYLGAYTECSFQRPTIEYKKTESNKETKEINQSEEKFKLNCFNLFYGVYMSLSF